MAHLSSILEKNALTASPSAQNPSAAVIRSKPRNPDKLLEETLNGPEIDQILSKRELQILKYIIEGLTNKEIAGKLYRTQRTVEYHRNRLMRKLDTHSTAELVRRAILMGIG